MFENTKKSSVYLVLFMVLFAVSVLIGIPSIEALSIDFRGYYAEQSEYTDPFQKEYDNLLRASMFAGVGTTYSHADSKHGAAAQAVRNCIEGNGVLQVWENPFTGYCAEVTKIDENTFGIRIVAKIKGKFEEITAFTHDVEGLWEVERYFVENSYMQIWGIP